MQAANEKLARTSTWLEEEKARAEALVYRMGSLIQCFPAGAARDRSSGEYGSAERAAAAASLAAIGGGGTPGASTSTSLMAAAMAAAAAEGGSISISASVSKQAVTKGACVREVQQCACSDVCCVHLSGRLCRPGTL